MTVQETIQANDDDHDATFPNGHLEGGRGSYGDSTAGGIKVNRTVWMAKVTMWQLRVNLGTDNENQRPYWNGSVVEREEAEQRTGRTLVILFVFMTTLAIGFLCLRLAYNDEIASERVLFQATSALGAVGLSMDLTGPDRPATAKVVEIVLMLAGRLEIIALLLVPAVLAGRVRRIENSDS